MVIGLSDNAIVVHNQIPTNAEQFLNHAVWVGILQVFTNVPVGQLKIETQDRKEYLQFTS